MLEPRESDIPALFLVLVVLPLVAYILLGKWSEAAKKKDRISLLAELAAEESLRAEAMAAANIIPLVPIVKNGTHECARCFSPATTRCSRCKSIRYCSGKCQIVHWREVHKLECQQLETNSSSSSPKDTPYEESSHERILLDDKINSHCNGVSFKEPSLEKILSDDSARNSHSIGAPSSDACATMERRSVEKRHSRKSSIEMLRKEDGASIESSGDASKSKFTCSTSSTATPLKDAKVRHKLRNGGTRLAEEDLPPRNNFNIPGGLSNGLPTSRGPTHGPHKMQSQHGDMSDSRTNIGFSSSSSTSKNGMNMRGGDEADLASDRHNADEVEQVCSSEMSMTKRSIKAKSAAHHSGTKMHVSPKSMAKASREQSCLEMERNELTSDNSKSTRIRDSSPTKGGSGITSMGFMKMIGLRKSSKHDRQATSEVNDDKHKKLKMLFPYDEFLKLFQYEVFDLSPRGLINCGNSCYANAALQCLTFTKPLTIYLLRGSHSKSCCMKNWCLMCELEQHVSMLRESGEPSSPSRILSHMRSINCQIGDGSQEDAHEFLRLLVTSMQSICLEGLGGEKVVNPKLQETTFIQHTFGGRLRSKVKCLKCHHESERYENIMDLTLEIYGWVESLEDALTQFTTPEDLDGENMYRCGRCATYVRARKQLSIHEAPNILTIVLKRFQEGSYGKINKCITFPEMLDMIPFMTGKDDIPPLYLLYALVVHLDNLNASFSGHYVSYVKDLQGNWFRIDDTEVQLVPMSQVMSEGAYILFYMRSSPRPARGCSRNATQYHASGYPKHGTPKAQKSVRPGEGRSSHDFTEQEPLSDLRATGNHTSNGILRRANRNTLPVMGSRAESFNMEFSDATSSDWSIFTSSDEASFTTESTRDSFSTIDYGDASNVDPISSIFSSYPPEYSYNRTVSCSMVSGCKPHTRFFSESKGVVVDADFSSQPLDRVWEGENLNEVGVVPSTEPFSCCGSYGSVHVNCGLNPENGFYQTFGHCEI